MQDKKIEYLLWHPAGSAFLYRFYEKPMTHLRDRFGKGHRTPAHAFKHPT